MIKWCAYCQQYQGEFAPIENKGFSHGICKPCAVKGLDRSDEEDRNLKYLVDLNRRFWAAGRKGDSALMRELAIEGIAGGLRPIDILYGMTGPLLTQVGDMWAANVLTVEDEHAFTASCESVVSLVSDLVWQSMRLPGEMQSAVLLTNVPGNVHSFGLRFANLGLAAYGIHSEVLTLATASEIVERAALGNYQTVGLSIALSSQVLELNETVDRLLNEPRFKGRVVVGGAAVAGGLVPAFTAPNVHLLPHPKFDSADIEYFR